MIKVLLTCAGGMSTSIIETKLQKYFRLHNLDMSVIAMAEGAARPHIRAKEFDIILVAPQVKYLLDYFKSISDGVPVALIQMQDYGIGNVDNIMKLITDNIKVK